ncbi:leukocyte immunoglobulin-like receptor subfamily B member 3, partial [Alexandromys fortis]|uniref:leukocyte immunoglobulin-like receptor subfamily B member 3 n=1 Tax=Alexandromys fortis TaxID=100897 RepID=UPI0021533C73
MRKSKHESVKPTLRVNHPTTKTLPKPVLRAQPHSVVSKQNKVTFLCEGATGAKEYRFYKELYQNQWQREISQNPKNKNELSISKLGYHHAGQYHCQYRTLNGWSEYSDSLELVVTGFYSKPSLSAQSRPEVTEGGNVTLQCDSWQAYDCFILTKEGPQQLSQTLDSRCNSYTWQYQAQFSVGPVTSSQRWTFRCYSYNKNSPLVWSEPSDPLELLVSGLTLDLGTPVLTETLPKPVLRAQPHSVVSKQNKVTFLCEGATGAKEYRFYKELYQNQWQREISQNPKNKNELSISKLGYHHAGQYHCQYRTLNGWSEYSDSLELVVTGFYSKPSLSAQSRPEVTEGGNVTLQCDSWQAYDCFILTKEGPQQLSQTLDSRCNSYTWQYQAQFSVGPVTSSQRWTFRCYSYNKNSPLVWSEPSDPLELLVSGLTLDLGTPVLTETLPKPVLRAQPHSVVSKQNKVTFLCEGATGAKEYRFYKELYQNQWQREISQNPKNKNELSISKLGYHHAGQYHCQYRTLNGWSEYSDSLELVVTGFYSKPSLSAQSRPEVTEGGNVTLQCDSWQAYDCFILTKEGPQQLSQTLDSRCNSYTWQYQAQFSVGPVTSSQRWTFRCYSYNKNSPLVWSEPSDPLELLVS